MKRNFGKTAAVMTAFAVMMSAGTTAFAQKPDDSAYGYQAGQQQNVERRAQFEEIAALTTDEEREAYFAEQEIGVGGPNSTAQWIDADELVGSGIIDQETADKIIVAASERNDVLHSNYAGKTDEMSPQERNDFFAGFKTDGTAADLLTQLVEDGVISQEQADAVNGYLAENSQE